MIKIKHLLDFFSHDPSFAIVFSQQVLLNSIFWG